MNDYCEWCHTWDGRHLYDCPDHGAADYEPPDENENERSEQDAVTSEVE